MDTACNMLLMKLCGFSARGVSTTYSTTVGNADAKLSVTMAPLADQVKISICPGVSTKTLSSSFDRFSHNETTWSNRVANKFDAVKIPPFGPKLYSFMTFL